MTDAEHAALSAQLARALGYTPDCVATNIAITICKVYGRWGNDQVFYWRDFDYRAPDVYGPLIERLGNEKVFPMKVKGKWRMVFWSNEYDTLPEAVARAVIALKGQR